jgi:hypothetical protein
MFFSFWTDTWFRADWPSNDHPELLDAFLLSRPRKRPRSYNHLLNTIRAVPLKTNKDFSIVFR